MTLNSVVLPAPLGPIRPVMWPACAVNETSVTALMPPKRTATSRTSRTSSVARRSATSMSAADVDKSGLLLQEDRSWSGGLGRGVHPLLPVRPQPSGERRDAAADPVRVAADTDRSEAGQEELHVAQLREVVVEHGEQCEDKGADERARRCVDAADAREQQHHQAEQGVEVNRRSRLRDAGKQHARETGDRGRRAERDELGPVDVDAEGRASRRRVVHRDQTPAERAAAYGEDRDRLYRENNRAEDEIGAVGLHGDAGDVGTRNVEAPA